MLPDQCDHQARFSQPPPFAFLACERTQRASAILPKNFGGHDGANLYSSWQKFEYCTVQYTCQKEGKTSLLSLPSSKGTATMGLTRKDKKGKPKSKARTAAAPSDRKRKRARRGKRRTAAAGSNAAASASSDDDGTDDDEESRSDSDGDTGGASTAHDAGKGNESAARVKEAAGQRRQKAEAAIESSSDDGSNSNSESDSESGKTSSAKRKRNRKRTRPGKAAKKAETTRPLLQSTASTEAGAGALKAKPTSIDVARDVPDPSSDARLRQKMAAGA